MDSPNRAYLYGLYVTITSPRISLRRDLFGRSRRGRIGMSPDRKWLFEGNSEPAIEYTTNYF